MSGSNKPHHSSPNNSSRLLSHDASSKESQGEWVCAVKNNILESGAHLGISVEEQLVLLDAFSHLELGQFLLKHHGLNAHWTHNVIAHRPTHYVNSLEEIIYTQLPNVLATRERFGIFQSLLQKLLRPDAIMISVPCGVMADLLLLDYTQHRDVKLIGIDLDKQALEEAYKLASQQGLENQISLVLADAWTIDLAAQADVITSNGLNVYEQDDDKVIELYRVFYSGLKPGGTLITSFMTPPPTQSQDSPWTNTAPKLLALQHVLFSRIIGATWTAFRTHKQTQSQLEQAGFTNIQFINDRMHMYPTVIANKTF
ncbi:class I SAM-dependent methyltransferase [Pectobacterium zantedeschiae]|uniref:Class I SAM-dependent methyltransferase n=1 Tax=Pectobacterium zantedeschiae TaxID=2034769 RepID=A0A9X8P3C5_9GAMM|nr:class I SAM-dependent methyltransferase [Pectobacterium zantedeschiae]RYC38920.1 class I SAM-dependent methyltransferase [Pectobacterium zantedeschiae]